MKVGKVYCSGTFAGTLTQDADGFVFRYDDAYFSNPSLPDVSATLPKSQIEYR